LPTDGFRAASAVDQEFANLDSDGVSGARRPMPQPAGQPAPPPSVGLIDQGQPQLAGAGKDHKTAKVAQNTDPVKPGFSLK
jgi:pilus assembly protein CpaC